MKTRKFAVFQISLFVMLASFIFMAGDSPAVDWHTANQVTVAWDAVTVREDGSALPAGESIEYSVYVSDMASKDSTNAAWRGSELQTTLTLQSEGEFLVGLQAHRIRDGTEVSRSVVVWSDDPVSTNDVPFGLRYFLAPAAAAGLRPL